MKFPVHIALTVLLLLFPLQHRQTIRQELFFLALIEEENQPGAYDIPPALATYERLLREHADKIGWDWRLLASVVYHESRFNNEAHSGAGATGLMQINSPRYPEDSLRIPSVNLSIGTRYLKKLEKMFPAANPLESLKFTLAAFNLGDGKVRRLVSRAADAGLDTTRWDAVAQLLPRGHHTTAYVEKVLDTFDGYCGTLPR